jgi:hypothetical protein
MDWLIGEAIEIELYLNNMNREDGLYLSRSWKPLTNSLKVHRNPPTQVTCPNCPSQDSLGPSLGPLLLAHHLPASSQFPPSPCKGLTAILSLSHIIPLSLLLWTTTVCHWPASSTIVTHSPLVSPSSLGLLYNLLNFRSAYSQP